MPPRMPCDSTMRPAQQLHLSLLRPKGDQKRNDQGEKILIRQLIIAAVMATGLVLPMAESAQAARPKQTRELRSLYEERPRQPEKVIDVWGRSSYSYHMNSYTHPNPVYPDYSGGLYYGNPTFGWYGNPGYVSPFWGMDVVYFY